MKIVTHKEISVCERGVYWAEKAYGDEVDYHWIYEFDDPDRKDAFKRLVDYLVKVGKNERSAEIAALLRPY